MSDKFENRIYEVRHSNNRSPHNNLRTKVIANDVEDAIRKLRNSAEELKYYEFIFSVTIVIDDYIEEGKR